MFFIYFACTFITAIFVYIDSEKQQMPRWWSAVVFFAPITMVYYLVKTRGKKSMVSLTAFLLIVILVGIGESFLYSRIKDKIIYSNYSATARDILRVSDTLKYSVRQLNDLTLELEDMNRVDSSTEKINEVLTFMDIMHSQMERTQRNVKKFVLVVNDYRNLLIDENFGWLLKIEEYYNEPVVKKYLKSLASYMDAFSALLRYTSENFEGISERDPMSLKNYDEYYMNYVRALDSHTLSDISRMQYQHNFLLHTPELEPYLPTILQKKFVNIWNKR